MGRTKLTDGQLELIALIPKAIRDSKDYTNAHKLVLAQLDLQDGTDFSAENNYVFASNKDLMKNTGIASEHTVINAVKRLLNEGLIETQRGYRRKGDIKASEYVLTDKYYGLGGRENPHKQDCNKDCNCSNATNTAIEAMQQQINELTKEIERLQNELKKINCSTDTETDTDIEKDTMYNTGNNNVSRNQGIKNTHCIVPGPESVNEKNDDNMKINEELIPQSIKDACEVLEQFDDFDYTQYQDIAEMVRTDTKGVKKDDGKQEWITRLFSKLECALGNLKRCYDKYRATGNEGYVSDIDKLFSYGDKKVELGWFTEGQIRKYEWYKKRYNGLMKVIRQRFGLDTPSDKDIEDTASASNAQLISICSSDSDESPAPPATKQTKKAFGDYDSLEEWKAAMKKSQEERNRPRKQYHISMSEVYAEKYREPMVEYNNTSLADAQRRFNEVRFG